jgi:hypothetical protein
MPPDYRNMTQWEKDVLDRLLSMDFPGCSELREQANHSTVRDVTEYGDNYGSIEFSIDDAYKHYRALVRQRVPVEGETRDSDGVSVYVLLHVINGVLNELEIYKSDSRPMKTRPAPDSIAVTIR